MRATRVEALREVRAGMLEQREVEQWEVHTVTDLAIQSVACVARGAVFGTVNIAAPVRCNGLRAASARASVDCGKGAEGIAKHTISSERANKDRVQRSNGGRQFGKMSVCGEQLKVGNETWK